MNHFTTQNACFPIGGRDYVVSFHTYEIGGSILMLGADAKSPDGWIVASVRGPIRNAPALLTDFANHLASVWAAMLAAPTLEEITEEDVQIATEAIRSAMERLR